MSSCKNGAAVVPKRAVSAGVDVAPSTYKQKHKRSGGLNLGLWPTLEFAEERHAHFENVAFSFWVPRLTGRAYAESQQRSRARRRERRRNKETAFNHRSSTSPRAEFNELWRHITAKSRSPV